MALKSLFSAGWTWSSDFFFASSSWVLRLQVKFILMALTVIYWNTIYEIEERVHLSHHCLPWIRRKYIFIILCCIFKGIVIYLFCFFKLLWTGKPGYICLFSNFPIVYFRGILFFLFSVTYCCFNIYLFLLLFLQIQLICSSTFSSSFHLTENTGVMQLSEFH